jgi:hypothetical protein
VGWAWGLSHFGDGGYLRLKVFIEKVYGEHSSLKKHIVFSPFMKAGGSLPCLQEPTTGPFPEPDEFNSDRYVMFL